MSGTDLRERLTRRLADARLIESRLEEAIAALDAGKQPAEVMADLFAPGMPRIDRMGDGGPRGGGPEGRPPLTEPEQARLMNVLRDRMPRVAAWASELERQDPRVLDMVRNRLLPRLREIEEERGRDPAGADARLAEFEASIGVMRATREYRQAVLRGGDGAALDEAKAGLRGALVDQFDARLGVAQHEIEMLGRRIESLRADVASQREGRAVLIDAAVDRITQDAMGQGVGDGVPPPPEGGGRPPR